MVKNEKKFIKNLSKNRQKYYENFNKVFNEGKFGNNKKLNSKNSFTIFMEEIISKKVKQNYMKIWNLNQKITETLGVFHNESKFYIYI